MAAQGHAVPAGHAPSGLQQPGPGQQVSSSVQPQPVPASAAPAPHAGVAAAAPAAQKPQPQPQPPPPQQQQQQQQQHRAPGKKPDKGPPPQIIRDFHLSKMIGKGNFSTVFQARKVGAPKGSESFALKRIQIFDILDEKARKKTLKEVDLLKELPPHKHTITFIDSFLENNDLYIVFEVRAFPFCFRLILFAPDF
jgi:hypothetical protein